MEREHRGSIDGTEDVCLNVAALDDLLAVERKVLACMQGTTDGLMPIEGFRAEATHFYDAITVAALVREKLVEKGVLGVVYSTSVLNALHKQFLSIGRVVSPDASCAEILSHHKILPSLQAVLDFSVDHVARTRAGPRVALNGNQDIKARIEALRFRLKKLAATEDRKHKRRANGNRRGLRRLVESVFNCRSKVLLVRVDLSVKDDSGRYNWEERESRDIGLFKKTLDRFNRRISSVYGLGCLAYAWKLEFGQDKRFHVHYFVMFDGHLHQQDVLLGKQLGEMWKALLPADVGLYYNCNAHKERYAHKALGMFESLTTAAVGVQYITDYFVKQDLLMSTFAGESRRSFGRSGFMKKGPRGRPRRCKSNRDAS